MKIHSITNTYTPRYTQRKSPNINSPKQYQTNSLAIPNYYNDISFGRTLSYEDFLSVVRKVNKNKSIKNVILSTISDSKNYIGSGFSANAFDIPNVPDYIFRIERKLFTPQTFIENPIIPEIQNGQVPNFGQYVAANGHGFFINKKVKGLSHSLPDWSEKIIRIENGEDIVHSDAKLILNKVKTLSEFPQESFNKLALKIKKLNKYTESEIDIINPNNLIVDESTKELGIIDLWYKHRDNGTHAPHNGIDSMVNLMLDPFSHKNVYEKLNFADKAIFKDSSETIIKKSLEAGKKEGLERTSINAMAIYRDFDKKLSTPFAVPSYNEFLAMYKHLL